MRQLADHPLVRGAVAWLVDAFEPAVDGWRCVPPEVDAYPHAVHWNYELHADDGPWPVRVHPQGEILAHLWASASASTYARRVQ